MKLMHVKCVDILMKQNNCIKMGLNRLYMRHDIETLDLCQVMLTQAHFFGFP